jgi:hypothetical protein
MHGISFHFKSWHNKHKIIKKHKLTSCMDISMSVSGNIQLSYERLKSDSKSERKRMMEKKCHFIELRVESYLIQLSSFNGSSNAISWCSSVSSH